MLIRSILTLVLAFLLLITFYHGLSRDPRLLPSPLINKPAPTFRLPMLYQEGFADNSRLQGKISLVNVWASWCGICKIEHPLLMQQKDNPAFQLVGWNYKDSDKKARNYLKQHKNPYAFTIVDKHGAAAIDWGVYGTPESYLIDKHGIIRYKVIGPITATIWNNELAPMIQKLAQE